MKLRSAALEKRPRASLSAIVLVTGGLVATSRSSLAFTTPATPRYLAVSSPTTNLLPKPQSAIPLFASSSQLPPQDADVVSERRVEHWKAHPPANPTKSTDPTPVLVTTLQSLAGDSAERSLLGPKAAVAAAALSLALLLSPLSASAAMSGGRMGGSFPSQPRQSITRPYSAPSYGQGYSQGFRSGFGSGYYSRPSITVAPYVSPFGGFNPFFSPFPRPFFYGSPGVITYSRGPSFLDLIVFGGISFVIFNAIRSAASGVNLADTASTWADSTAMATSALGSGTSVVQLSVALEVPNRDSPNSILSVLNRLSQTARTDSRVGLQNLTSQVALELLRRKSSIVSAASRYQHYRDRNKAQREYNALSVQERGKFEQETVSKYGGVDYSSGSARSRSTGQDGAPSQATVAVVTLLLAIDGDSTKVPVVNSIQDVEEALRRIAADAKVDSCLQTAEILWTPEDRSETLTLRDVIADYPQLRAV